MTLPDPRPSSLAAHLRQHHQDLARRCLSQPIGADERQAFIDELAASGKELPPGRDRDAVRKLLYYWTADAVSRGERLREQQLPSLEPFGGDAPSGDSAVTQVLTTAQTTDDIEATTADTRAAIRIATLARQWLADDRRTGYLLTEGALKEAERLADKDQDIRALVDASKAAETQKALRSRRILIGVVAGLVAVIVVMSVGGVFLWRLNRELQQANYQAYEAIAEQTAINRRNEEEARGAIDALNRGYGDPLEPLRKLLARLAGAQTEELDRLQYKPPAQPPTAPGDRVVADPASVVVQRPAPASLGTCEGALWLGSDADKRVTFQGELRTLKAGDTVTTTEGANIRLRKDMPSDDYVMAPQVGLIPGGSTVSLTAAPEEFQRPGAVQYFARVKAPRQYCTRVFVQFAGERSQADQMLTQLRQLGVQAPGAENVAKVPAEPEVRVFFQADLGVANYVADQLKAFNAGRRLVVKTLYDFKARPVAGTIEVWIELKK